MLDGVSALYAQVDARLGGGAGKALPLDGVPYDLTGFSSVGIGHAVDTGLSLDAAVEVYGLLIRRVYAEAGRLRDAVTPVPCWRI